MEPARCSLFDSPSAPTRWRSAGSSSPRPRRGSRHRSRVGAGLLGRRLDRAVARAGVSAAGVPRERRAVHSVRGTAGCWPHRAFILGRRSELASRHPLSSKSCNWRCRAASPRSPTSSRTPWAPPWESRSSRSVRRVRSSAPPIPTRRRGERGTCPRRQSPHRRSHYPHDVQRSATNPSRWGTVVAWTLGAILIVAVAVVRVGRCSRRARLLAPAVRAGRARLGRRRRAAIPTRPRADRATSATICAPPSN